MEHHHVTTALLVGRNLEVSISNEGVGEVALSETANTWGPLRVVTLRHIQSVG